MYSPVDPITKKYEDYCTILSNHFDKKKLEVAERFNFYQRKQGPTETIKEYSAELRDLARHCNFGTFLDSALRDAFVMGIKDERVQRKLLTTDALTFNDAIKTAEASESLENQSQSLRPNRDREEFGLNVNVAQETRGGNGRCHRCLGWNHAPQYCPFLRETCYKCQQVGHTAAACHTQSTRQNQVNPRGGDRECKDRPEDSTAQSSPTDIVIKNKDVQQLVVGFPGDEYTSRSRKAQGWKKTSRDHQTNVGAEMEIRGTKKRGRKSWSLITNMMKSIK